MTDNIVNIVMNTQNSIQAPILPFVFSPFVLALLRRHHIVAHNAGQAPEDGDEDGHEEEDGLKGISHYEGFKGLHLRAEIPGDTLDGVLRILVGGFPGSRVVHGGEDAR